MGGLSVLTTRVHAPSSRRQRLLLRCTSDPYPSATEIAEASRRRRVRRSDRQTAKRPEPAELEERFQQAVIDEDAKWVTPSVKELAGQTIHPILEGVFNASVEQMLKMNGQCCKLFIQLFEKKFPASRPAVDYIEYHLLEVDGKGVASIIEFFQDLGYKEKRSFSLPKADKPIQCRVFEPSNVRIMPKVVISSLNVNEALSEKCQNIIRKRMNDWLPLAGKYGATALGVGGVPWEYPTEREYETIEKESSFAARCLAYGHVPSCVAISVNEMRKVAVKFGTDPGNVTPEMIRSVLEGSYPLNPSSKEPVWENSSGSLRVIAPVAEIRPASLLEGMIFMLTGSHIAFIERSVLPEFIDKENDAGEHEPEQLDQEINEELLSFMHGSIDAALLVDAQVALIHEKVMQRAQDSGKVLTLDGSNEEDEELYKYYCAEIAPTTALPKNLAPYQLREMSARSFVG